VSGCGKSTIGQLLASRLDAPFFDGDDFHPPENIAKMAAGRPLTDDDRFPWLLRLRQLIDEQLAAGKTAVIACSALKKVTGMYCGDKALFLSTCAVTLRRFGHG